jgi:predicted PurR-regulated permease PerM
MATVSNERYERWRMTALIAWAVIGILLLVATTAWALGKIAEVLVPFVMAFIIVFLLNVPVRKLVDRGMSRGAATLLCLAVTLGVLGGLFSLLGPAIAKQFALMVQPAQGFLDQVQAAETAMEGRVSAMVMPEWLAPAIKDASLQLGKFIVSLGDGLARLVLSAGGKIALALLDVFLSLIIAFWVLKDLPKIRSEITVLVGPDYEADAEHLLATVTRVVGGYLRGQTIASLTTASISTITLSVMGVPYALVFGLFAFTLNFAPYVGPMTAGMFAALLGSLVSPWMALAAVGAVIVAQNFTDFVVVPRVMSEQVDLHPTLVIFSLLIGGTLFGVPGLLFAIPVAATVKGLFVYYYQRRTDRQLGSTDGALFRHSAHTASSRQDPVECDATPKADTADNTE